MTSPNEHNPAAEYLFPVEFPYALRGDGLANTYLDLQGDVYIEPTEPHDFAFSVQLHDDRFSGGEVVERNGSPRYIRYDGGSELISLPAVLNSSIGVADGDQDIYRSLALVGQLLDKAHKAYGALPLIDSIDSIAIDRLAGRAEILPPYHVTSGANATDILKRLRSDAMSRAVTREELETVGRCFAVLLGNLEAK